MRQAEPPTWLELGALAGLVAASVTSVASLLLAWVGLHDGWVALLVGLGATAGLVVVVLRRPRDWRPALPSVAQVAILGGLIVVAGVQFFPGFPMAVKNRDPGVYINHAVAIAREGSDAIPDPVFDTAAEVHVVDGDPRLVTSEGDIQWRRRTYRGFATDPNDDERLLPSFFHLWPTTLATAYDLGGRRGLFNLTPILALGAVVLVFLATRRALGLVAASVAGGLLAVNMLEVWQAKFPTAEALTQFLYAGALLAVAMALATRWRVAAGIAGGVVGMGFVARPEGLYIVFLALGVLALLWGLEAWDGRATAFLVGLAPPALIGAYQAYVRATNYLANQEGLPSRWLSLMGVLVLVVGAVALRWLRHRRLAIVERVSGIDPQRALTVAAWALAGAYLVFLVVAWLRPQLFGESYRVDKEGARTRGYDEQNLRRLGWFLTVPGLVLAWLGLVVAAWKRWSAVAWAIVLPGVLVAPVLIWEPRIAPNLMWWGRRYVPMVLVTLLILIGGVAAAVWDLRKGNPRWLRAGVVVVVLATAALMLRQSNDLWGHREFGGSTGVVDELESVTNGQDVAFVWQAQADQTDNFGLAAMTWLGLPSLTGPPRPTGETLEAIQAALGRPILVVTEGEDPPPGAADVLVLQRRIQTSLTKFQQLNDERPTASEEIPVDLSIWRLAPEATEAAPQ
jgi:hypothetical protein